jgi:hypothetical protein
MPYGYIGQNLQNQTVKNAGVFSISDVADLEKQGKFGGSLELIESQSASGVSSIIFDEIKENKYDIHLLQIINFSVSTYNQNARIRFYENGVEETAAVYEIAYTYGDASGSSFAESKSTAYSHLRGTYSINTTSTDASNSYSYFYNLGNSSKYSFQNLHVTGGHTTSADYRTVFGSGLLKQASKVDGIKIYVSSGTFDCTAKLYGLKQL